MRLFQPLPARLTLLLCGCLVVMSPSAVADERAASPPHTSQREFTSPVPLLDDEGSLRSWGWARRALIEYNRSAIPTTRQGRIKEWEHYTVMSPDFTVGVTIVQLGGMAIGSAELIDYRTQSIKNAMFRAPAKADTPILPSNPWGQTRLGLKDDFVSMAFADKLRRIQWQIGPSKVSVAFAGDLKLQDDPRDDSIAITRPLGGEGEFFYENKTFGMPATGTVNVDGQTYTLPAGDSWAIFDWGRGIWPRDSQWFWGQAAGRVAGKQVAINLGHGYGDDTHGTCNAILVDGRLHKLDVVDCQFNSQDRRQPWQFTSNNDRLTLVFEPIYQQHSKQDVGFIRAELFKIHGRYSGTLVLDDGTRLETKDLLGFAEHMEQRW